VTDLAAFVLGLIWQNGPCSAYAIRRMLADSPSSQWSASAGAIYPLVERLERDGLIVGADRSAGKRERREYKITAAGRRGLKRWIGPPLNDDAITVTTDPLRSRVRFLALLSFEERGAWLDAAEAALDDVAARVAQWDERYADATHPELALLTHHAELETAFRRAWLAEVRTVLDAAPSGLASGSP